MTTKTVVIECDTDEQGNMTYMVGLEPAAGEPEEQGGGQEPAENSPGDEQAEKSWMSPAKSIEDALQVARDLLTSDQAQSAENNAAFEGGYKKAGGPTGIEALNTRGMK